MSIPKVINYCWFGKGELPDLAKKCIASWKKHCPDYEIKRWDETNVGEIDNLYARQAFKAKKWAFVSDYFRLKIIYEQGGIYLDTDVELIKSLDSLVERYDGFFGYEKGENLIATGLGFGAKKGDKFVKAMLDEYDGISFLGENGEFDTTPCPKRNTKALLSLGLDTALRNQVIDNVCFLNEDVLCPINFFTGKKQVTRNTVSIHHYGASWCSEVTRRTLRLKRIIGNKAYCFIYGKFLHRSDRWEW